MTEPKSKPLKKKTIKNVSFPKKKTIKNVSFPKKKTIKNVSFPKKTPIAHKTRQEKVIQYGSI